MSKGILAQLKPAALNYLTSRSHSPPLSSNHSSVSSSLCSQEEKWGSGENGKFWWIWAYDLCLIVFTYAHDSILLCIIINYAICPIVKKTHMIFGWLGIASFLEDASAGWAPEWLISQFFPWSHLLCHLCSSPGHQWQSTTGEHALKQ